MKNLGLILTMIALGGFSFESYANQKAHSTLHPVSKNRVTQFLRWQNAVGSFHQFSQKDISAYYAKKFSYSINGKLVATDANSLHQRYINVQQQYKMAYIHFPVNNLHINGEKVAMKYLVTFVDKHGRKNNSNNTVFIKFNHDGKIERISQSFDKGYPHVSS